MIRLYDSVDGEVRELNLRDPGRVSMYVCGPTVDNLPHLGHGRFTLVWDVARRWFTFRGLDVNYVSNITDIDDKIIARSLQEDRSTAEVVATYEALWWEAMDQLGVARPDEAPHATDYVPEMIELISAFLEDDIAYTISDGVYLDVSRVPDYGLLAGQPLESLRVGARVEAVEEKRSPLDFALWKNAKAGEPSWPAPFGDGRPGWHTECVVMSLGLLGDDFDLHCGGLDLKFPHHENEIAQSEGAHQCQYVNYWMHNGFVNVDKEKMSKSLGNFFTIREVLKKYDVEVVRFFILRAHYRSPLNYSDAHLDDAKKSLDRLYTALNSLPVRPEPVEGERATQSIHASTSSARTDLVDWSAPYAARFKTAMNDDFNTPEAVAVLFDLANEVNRTKSAGAGAQLKALGDVLGLLQRDPEKFLQGDVNVQLTGVSAKGNVGSIDALINERTAAKKARNFAEADRIRKELLDAGIVLEDSPVGTTWRRA